MNSAFDFRAMGLLLLQGRQIDKVSRLLLVLTLLTLIVAPHLTKSPSVVASALLSASLLASLVQLYFAIRIGFDAELMLALADRVEREQCDAASARDALDAMLQALALQSPAQSGRNWATRWQGMGNMMRAQAACLLVQFGLLLSAVIWGSLSPLHLQTLAVR